MTLFLLSAAFGVCSQSMAVAAPLPRNGPAVATTVAVRGGADLRFDGGDDITPLVKDQSLLAGDRITTHARSRAAILFNDRTRVKINENATLTIAKPKKNPAGLGKRILNLFRGEVWSRFKGTTTDSLEIHSPVAIAAIQGTDWFLRVDPVSGRTMLVVHSGRVQLSNARGSVEVGRNEAAVAEKDRQPSKIRLVNPREGTQWVQFSSETLRFFTFYRPDAEALRQRLVHLETTPAKERTRRMALERGRLLHDLGRLEESSAQFQTLHERSADAGSRIGLALIHLHKGDWPTARKLLSPLPVDLPSAPFQVLRALLAAHDNRLHEAETTLSRARITTGDPVLVQAARLYLLLLRGAFEKIETRTPALLNRFADDPRLATLLFETHLLTDRTGDAETLSRRVVERWPNTALAHFDRAWFSQRVQGRDQPALAAYDRGLRLSPENPTLLTAQGNLLRRMGLYHQALKRFRTLLQRGYQGGTVLYHYALLASQTDEDLQARQLFTRARTAEGRLQSLAGEGIALLKLGEPEKALDSLLRATMMAPDNAENHIHLAIAHYQLGQTDAALDALDEAARADPRDSTPYIIQSMIFNDLYEPYKAIQAARKAEERLPYRKKGALDLLKATKNGMANVASSLSSLGLDFWSFKKSMDILRLDPYDPNAHLFPGVVHTNLGNVLTAQGEYAQGAIMDPSVLVESNRDGTILKKPDHYQTVKLRLGTETNQVANQETVKLSGFFADPARLDYLAQFKRSEDLSWPGENDGLFNLKETGERDGEDFALLLGWHPAYHTDLYGRFIHQDHDFLLSRYENKFSRPYLYFSDDVDQESRYRHYELGYHRRFSPSSHLLIRPYRLTYALQGRSAGDLDPFGLHTTLLPAPLAALDPGLTVDSKLEVDERGFQVKQFFDFGAHRLSFGAEHLQRRFDIEERAVLQLPAIPGLDPTLVDQQVTLNQRAWNIHFRDGWQIGDDLFLDLGAALQHNFVDTVLEDRAFHWSPRLGAEYNLSKRDTLRLAWQEHRFPRDLPVTSQPAGVGLVDISDVAFRPGVGQLETSDVAGIPYYEHAAFGITPKVEELRFRWEREWSPHFFHASEIGRQRVRNVGNFMMLWNSFNWIVHPRVGTQFTHMKLFDLEYAANPYEMDLLSRDSTRMKVIFVHPSHLRLTFWHEYHAGKPGQYDTIDDLNGHHRLNAMLNWESEDKRYGIDLFWFNMLRDRELLPGLPHDDAFAYVNLELRL